MSNTIQQTTRRTKAVSGLAVIFLVAWLLAGCVNIAAIQAFSKISAQSAAYQGIVSDYSESAVRMARYAPSDSQLVQNVENVKVNQKNLTAIEQAVSDYMAALGKLSGDQQTAISKSTGSLVDAMVSTKLVSTAEQTAAKSLADIAVRVFTQERQEVALRDIIQNSNAPFQKLIGALKIFVGQEYIAQIADENGRLKQTLQENIVERDFGGSNQKPAQAIAGILYSEKTTDLDAKKAAAIAYLPILQKISEGHQALYDHRDNLKAKDLLSELSGYTTDIQNLAKSIKL